MPRLLVPGFRGSILARLRILRRPARAPILQLSSGSGQEAEGYERRSVSSGFKKILLRPVILVFNIGQPISNSWLYLEGDNVVVLKGYLFTSSFIWLYTDGNVFLFETWVPSPHSLKLVIDTIDG